MPKNTKASSKEHNLASLKQRIEKLTKQNEDIKEALVTKNFERGPHSKIDWKADVIDKYITKESDVIALRKEINDRIATQMAQGQQLKDKDNELFQLRKEKQTLLECNNSQQNIINKLRADIEHFRQTRPGPMGISERQALYERTERRKMITCIVSECIINTNERISADIVSNIVDTAKRIVDEVERRTP